MKNRLFYGIAIFVIAVVAAVNVNISSQSESLSYNVSLTNVDEALAGEWWDNFCSGVANTLQGQGWTKDEKTYTAVCTKTTYYNESGSFGGSVTSPTGNLSANGGYNQGSTTTITGTEISCSSGGNENCTPHACG